eukprot:7388772-Prymnesium_polylepis.2
MSGHCVPCSDRDVVPGCTHSLRSAAYSCGPLQRVGTCVASSCDARCGGDGRGLRCAPAGVCAWQAATAAQWSSGRA